MTENWTARLLELEDKARRGQCELSDWDELGYAAYKANAPEALTPFQNYYKYPKLATHMARAFMMLGDVTSTKEFLQLASEGPLKAALHALLELEEKKEAAAEMFLSVARKYPELEYPEYWRAVAAVADAVKDTELVRLGEQRSQAFAWDDPNIHFNQALRMLGAKEFSAAWPCYEARLIPGCKNPCRTQLGKMSKWEGESLKGKSIVVFLEQGLGDCILALRYLRTLLYDEGATVEVVARKALLALVVRSFPEVKVHDEDEVAFVDYWQRTKVCDFWTYSLSVPAVGGYFEPRETAAYLHAEQALVAEVALSLKALNPQGLPVYTINWHGRIDSDADKSRAYGAEEFLTVSELLHSPCVIVSVQVGATDDEISEVQRLVREAGGVFVNAGPLLKTFSDTAAWICNSDHLLTCDTSVAHLGGALGHPTTVLVRNPAIWQWTVRDLQPSDRGPYASVWYDSAQVLYALAPARTWLMSTTERATKSPPVVRSRTKPGFRFAGHGLENPESVI
jgi:hypothetical protein